MSFAGAAVVVVLVLAWAGGVSGYSQLVMEQTFQMDTMTCEGVSCRREIIGANETLGVGAVMDCSPKKTYWHGGLGTGELGAVFNFRGGVFAGSVRSSLTGSWPDFLPLSLESKVESSNICKYKHSRYSASCPKATPPFERHPSPHLLRYLPPPWCVLVPTMAAAAGGKVVPE